jgi:hypothetical protein
MSFEYKNLVFTKHAKERINDRILTAEHIFQAIKFPDNKFIHKTNKKFIKLINSRKIHVIANFLPKENKWLIISAWVRGEEDRQPLVWRLITLPFRLLFWIFKKIKA